MELRALQDQRIELSLHRPWLGFAAGGFLIVSSLGLAILVGWRGPADPERAPLIYGLAAVVFILGALMVLMGLRQRALLPSTIAVCVDGLEVPHPSGLFGPAFVHWSQIEAAYVARALGQRRLFLYAPGAPRLIYPERAFPSPDVFDALHQELRSNMRRLPGGEARLAASGAAQLVAQAVDEGPFWFGYITGGFLLGVFLGLQDVGPLSNPLRATLLGGNVAGLTLPGEPWRVLTAFWLHLDLGHVIGNMAGLVVLSRLVEGLLGRPRCMVIIACGAVLGGFVSVLFGNGSVSIGASAGIYGLLGAWVSLWWRRRDELPIHNRFTPRYMLGALAIGALVEFMWPGLDFLGHAGGFLAGLAVTPALLRRPLVDVATSTTPCRVWLASAVATTALIAAMLWIWQAGEQLTGRIAVAAWHEIGEKPVNRVLLNDAAWEAAIDPEAGPGLLEWATGRAQIAAQGEGLPAATDTLATLYYRLGNYDRAIALESSLEDGDHVPSFREFYASQRARFEYARARDVGPRLSGDCPAPRLRADDQGFHSTVAPACERGAVVRWGVVVGGALVGFSVARLGPHPPHEITLTREQVPRGLLEPDVGFVLTDVSRADGKLGPGEFVWLASALSPGVEKLP